MPTDFDSEFGAMTRSALVAYDRSSTVDDMNAPPAEVGAEEGNVAASRYEIFHPVTRRLAPVFVVPHTEQQAIAIA